MSCENNNPENKTSNENNENNLVPIINSDDIFKYKYLKYKTKYLNLLEGGKGKSKSKKSSKKKKKSKKKSKKRYSDENNINDINNINNINSQCIKECVLQCNN